MSMTTGTLFLKWSRSMNPNFSIESTIVGNGEKGIGCLEVYQRGTNRCFLVEVEQRDEATLRRLIERWISPGTKIMSDGWRAYRNINTYQDGIYQHEVVIHEHNFVDPYDRDIHTQNVESMWSRAKRMFRKMYATSTALFESYLVEFMWRESFGNGNPFSAILCNIAGQYLV